MFNFLKKAANSPTDKPMKKNTTRVLLWILWIGFFTAVCSQALPAASPQIPLLNHPPSASIAFQR